MDELKNRILLALSINKIRYDENGYIVDCHTTLPLSILSTIIGKNGIGDVVASIHQHADVKRIIIHTDRTNSLNKTNYIRGTEYHNGEYRSVGCGPNYYAESWIIEASIALGINMYYLKQVDDTKYRIRDTNWTLEELNNTFPQYKFEQVNGKLYITEI